MESTERLFFGIHLYPLFKDEIEAGAAEMRAIYPQEKWVHLENVHFTIHFLGDTLPEQKRRVVEVAHDITQNLRPFTVALEGVSAFPDLESPRIVWIGAATECLADLTHLYDCVTPPLVAAGFPLEREKFTPHATIFRARHAKDFVFNRDVLKFKKTAFKTIDKIYLFKSVLTPSGSEYYPQEVFYFKKEASE